ncbi:hypothetical protein [Eubacterium coprostanoligenes]|uniref:hypothetical protein n=1 Tax=Eubacterium coprostanoligenes TaxID=290054 RepID=UPI002355A912|nr:hypothetical protein [Eubacterium coprostanoligenes]MCI6253875.1 hypothetical protein [Eubacterium coprostanoligenes]MDY5400961.1 hypothetical protein [Eubacterium coprostanoligenes]
MKKSFKKVVAILLAVMMIVCSVPLTVFASDDANRANINLQFGDVSCTTTKKTVLKPRSAKMADYLAHSGLNSDKLTYSNGKIDGYATGDFFTVSVLLENVTELSAAEVAIKYSEAIEPAYIIDYKGRGDNVTVAYMYNEVTTEGPHADFPINEAVPSQSGNALYNSTSTLGETSYVDPEARIMHANFAVQTGADSVSLTDSKAVLATFMFKIVNDQPITFSIDNTQSDPYETYTLGTIANGGKVEEYKTYAKVSEADVPALDFMGENEYNGTVGKNYTITFVNADGQQISSAEYKEGTAIVPPSLPATTHDDAQHYTYAWDKEVPATATANGTYTIIKTGAVHTWDAGVVTTEPTTTTTGVKTYTCTFDGCGATRTETLPKVEETHQHTWSEWTYNNDAVYVSKTDYKDGTATRKCNDPNCPEHATETKTIAGTGLLRVNSASVTLGAAVVMNIGIDTVRTTPFKETYVKVEFGSGKYDVTDKSNKTTSSRIYYDFDKVSPDMFGEEVSVTAYAVTEDGIVCKGHAVTTSIKDYAYKTLNKTTNEAMKELLVEMLYYGTAYQNYRNYKVDQPVTDNLTEEQKALHTTDVPEYVKLTNSKFELNPNGTAANDIVVKAANLLLEGKVIPQIKIEIPKTKNIADYTFTWKVNDKVVPFTYTEHPEWFVSTTTNNSDNNAYYVQCTILQANQFSIPFYFTAYKGSISSSNQASNVCQYSVESYATGSVVKNNPVLKALVDQILRYGRADVKYMGGTADL